jgi:putative selenate reductase
MSEIMRPVSFADLVRWSLAEYRNDGAVFGVRKEKFYRGNSKGVSLLGTTIASPIGPAAGPNSQLAQNIVAAYLAGSRFVELKTVQTMDGEELRKCVARPCINAEDEGYNVEWSTELTVPEAFDEYVKGWFLIHVLGKEYGLSSKADFIFNMSVGYSLEGIQSTEIDTYIEGLKNAKNSAIWRTCYAYLAENIRQFSKFTKADLDAISGAVSTSVTLSTLHGCPRDEIERIAHYLITEKGVHTYIKCNPTLLGYETARKLLDEMGYTYLSFDDHHFKDDLQFDDAVAMLGRLRETAKQKGLAFGVKITNTFPVDIKRNELPGNEMYMSGRALFPLSINVARKLSEAFKGELPISYSGGADYFNLADILKTGIRPITVATTILKPGGYERLAQLAQLAETAPTPADGKIAVDTLQALAASLPTRKRYRKDYRETGSRKTGAPLPLFDCANAPCMMKAPSQNGCPIQQKIPAYLAQIAAGNYAEAFRIIAVDNTAPSVTGTICDHQCQSKCTRVDYDDSLEIRAAKKLAAEQSQDAYIKGLSVVSPKTDKRVAIIGAGPAGIAAAIFLRRNGVAVTVFEKRDKPYGIVRYVIPSFRISDAAIERDYQLAVKLGVEFKFGASENYALENLKSEYAFVILATGAWKEGSSPVKGHIDALKFLEDAKTSGYTLDIGKRVAVIGGGDVAMDCARAAKRNKGVEKATIVYRRTREFMPAQSEEIELALADGVEVIELCAPLNYMSGVLTCEIMTLGDYDASGRRGIVGTGKKTEMQFDTVIGAVGARVDTSLFAKNGLALDSKGFPALNATGESSVSGVYVAGDCKAGPATVVKAIADSKTIAADILCKLNLANDFSEEVSAALDLSELYARKGVISGKREGASDANRCLSCVQVCEVCCDVCPNRANVLVKLHAADGGAAHQVVHIDRMCNECGNCAIFCPHADKPYTGKFTVFSSEEDFTDSKNRGFLSLGNGSFKLRLEDDRVVTWRKGETSIPAQFAAMVSLITEKYSYLITEVAK